LKWQQPEAGADAQRHRHDPAARHAQHIDDGLAVEHGHRAALVDAPRQVLEQGLARSEMFRCQIAEAEFEDAGSGEGAADLSNVAEMLQRQHQASRHARESCARCAISARLRCV